MLTDSARRGTLSALGGAYLARFALPGTLREEDVQAGTEGFYSSYDRAARGQSGRALLSLHHRLERGGHAIDSRLYGGYRTLSLLENYTGALYNPVDGDRRRQTQDAFSYGADLRYRRALAARVELDAGIGTRGDVLAQAQRHVDWAGAPQALERALEGAQSLTHALAGLRLRPVESLRVVIGARLDLAQINVRDGLSGERGLGLRAAASPRFTARWQPRAQIALFGSYGRGFRPPEARAFTPFVPPHVGLGEERYDGGDPSMSLADSFELGARWAPERRFHAALSTFATLLARESIFDHVSGVSLELNRTRRLGAELALGAQPIDWLELRADITYVDARFVTSGRPVPFAPWLSGGAHAMVAHPVGLSAALHARWLAARALPHGARGAPMAVVDASAGYRWERIELSLQVENLLAREVREGEYHYASQWDPAAPPSLIPAVHYAAGPPINARLSLAARF